MSHDSLDTPIYVSIPVVDSIMVDQVYWSCVVTIGGYEARVDILLLYIVDFDMILGMDWLYSNHDILDWHAMIVMFAMTGLTSLELESSLGHIPSKVVSFLKAQWIVEKGFLSYLDFFRDVSVDTPIVDSVPVVRKFPDAFPADLPGIPSDRHIDLTPATQPISILPYYMALEE
ncbi:uncharacterized protein LOC142181752 [Nicotiana tabacum]|uniref:Uncharacterized protein LOC142181752 n=1 Tax=Nicotiana tabacum TaxID=4097 RepID=A0AC58UPF8_TOBAC